MKTIRTLDGQDVGFRRVGTSSFGFFFGDERHDAIDIPLDREGLEQLVKQGQALLDIKLCSNCGSQKHQACCERCGKMIPSRRRGFTFCSQRCEKEQHNANEVSKQMEENDLEQVE